MFGQDGLTRMADASHRLLRFWKKQNKFVMGVFIRNTVAYVVRLENRDGQWELYENVMVPIPAVDTGEDFPPAELAVEKIVTMMQVMGWPAAPIAMCLAEDEVFTDTLHIPVMPDSEMCEAVHWELDGQRDFDDPEFLSVFRSSSGDEGQWAAAVPKTLVDIWRKAWKENGMELESLTVMPAFVKTSCALENEGLRVGDVCFPFAHEPYDVFYDDGGWEALHAAKTLCYPEASYMNFLTAGKPISSAWNWKSLSLTVTAVISIGLFGCFFADYGQLSGEQEALAAQKSQLAFLSHAQKEKSLLENAEAQIRKKNQQLVRLSEESYPWRSILIHLGTMTVDGVGLSEITVPKPNELEIHGKAIQYEALAEFLQKFEGDREFFPSTPILKSSQVEAGEANSPTIAFQLTLKLDTRDDVYGTPG